MSVSLCGGIDFYGAWGCVKVAVSEAEKKKKKDGCEFRTTAEKKHHPLLKIVNKRKCLGELRIIFGSALE